MKYIYIGHCCLLALTPYTIRWKRVANNGKKFIQILNRSECVYAFSYCVNAFHQMYIHTKPFKMTTLSFL